MKLRLFLSSVSSALLAAGICLGAASYKPGTLLEYADHQGHSYYCIEAHDPDHLLIGHATHAQLKSQMGKPVLLKYDDESIWVRSPHGRTLRLRQDYLTRAFPPGSPCEQVVEAALKRLNAPQKNLIVRDPH